MISNMTHVKKNSGFLMIEILIAIAIFSIGFLAVGTMILSTTKNNTTGNIATQATMLAVDKLEQLKSMNIDDLIPVNADGTDTAIKADGSAGGIYTREWIVSDLSPPSLTARYVEVTVSWRHPTGGNRDITMATVTRGGGI